MRRPVRSAAVTHDAGAFIGASAPSAGARRSSRVALLDAALEEFSAKGYESATVAGIAERAGVTTGAVYAHFNGKLDLLINVIGLTPVDELLRAVTSTPPRTRAEAVRMLRATLVAHPDPRTLLLLDVIVVARRDPEVASVLRDGLQSYLDFSVSTTRAGMARGLFDPVITPDDLSRLLGLVALGTIVFEAIGERSPSDAACARLAELLLGPPQDEARADHLAQLELVRRRADELGAARAELDDAMAAAVAAGHSLRQVGEAAGLSHERVRSAVPVARGLVADS
jgi:AcrR family transcriptional regulator